VEPAARWNPHSYNYNHDVGNGIKKVSGGRRRRTIISKRNNELRERKVRGGEGGVTEYYTAALVESFVCDTSSTAEVTVGITASENPSCWNIIDASGGESLRLTFAFFFDSCFLGWFMLAAVCLC
jgi:hypothetical protein